MKKQVVILVIAILLITVSGCKFWESLCKKCTAPESVEITDFQYFSEQNELALNVSWTSVQEAISYNLRIYSINDEENIDSIYLEMFNIIDTSYLANLDIPVGTAIKASVSSNCRSSVSSYTISVTYIIYNGGGTVDIVPYSRKPNFTFAFTSSSYVENPSCMFFKFTSKTTSNCSSIGMSNPNLLRFYYRKTDIYNAIRNNYVDECAVINNFDDILEDCPQYIKYGTVKSCGNSK